jgi:peptidyl-prolyl cis-trans isomerase D
MLNTLRKGASTWVAKILIGLLMLSFAVWGINDIFTGYRGDALITVGKTEVPGESFRTAFQSEMQRVGQRIGRPLTMDEARGLGLDGQIIGQLVTQAVMDEKGREVGLSMTDAAVANSIVTDPNFTSSNGSFDRFYFENVLRNIGLSEAQFAAERRSELVRQALGEAVVSGIPAPETLNRAVHDFASEERTMDYFVISAAALPAVEAPELGMLVAWFEDNKARYAAPEYRKLGVIVLEPSALADPDSVSDDEALADYEARLNQFGESEKRRISQIVFPTEEEAQSAASRIAGGASFDEIAAERGISAEAADLGLLTQAEMVDPAVGEAAFALEQGAISDPIDGQFGTTLIRLEEIVAGSRQAFEDVRDDIKQRLAERRSEERVLDLYDVIEDARAGGQLLSEVASANGLEFRTIDAVDARGNDPENQAVEGVPALDGILRDAFESDVGIENDPIQLRGTGFVWYEVLDVEAPRERKLSEVQERAEADWIAERQAAQLGEAATDAVTALRGGENILSVARRNGASVTTARGLTRFGGERPDIISDAAVERLFTLPQGGHGQAAGASDETRLVFSVAGRNVPAFDASVDAARQTEQRIQNGVGTDLLEQYVAGLRDRFEIDVNGQLLAELLGDRPAQGR